MHLYKKLNEEMAGEKRLIKLDKKNIEPIEMVMMCTNKGWEGMLNKLTNNTNGLTYFSNH